jgi:putative NADH-flavin reductase
MQGNLLSAADLETAIQNHDAILSAFGPRLPISEADSHLLREFGAALTKAMPRTTVRRAVVVSSAFLFKDSLIPPTHLAGRLFFPNLLVDAAGMESVLVNSALDWTILRPPRLNDKPRTSRYRVRDGHLPRFGFAISRADVADFMIKTLENHASIHKIVGLAN